MRRMLVLLAVMSLSALARADIDRKALVARADLHYDKPAARSEEGMPIGNGRMGTLVWTSEDAVRMQINRVDVFATDSNTRSFPRSHSDYASGCAYVDGHGLDLSSGFEQHLSIYDGVMTLKGNGVTARVIASQQHDVIAIEIAGGGAIDVDLRMLRYANQYVHGTPNDLSRQHAAVIQTNAHRATMRNEIRGKRIATTQQFREGDYYNSSAVVIETTGGDSKPSYHNGSTIRLAVSPLAKTRTILIASAATFDPNEDVIAMATKQLDAAAGKGFDKLLEENRTWWRDFWSRSFVRLHSDDGEAELIEQNYTYFMYVMASCSRGSYPARFGGMLWYSNGDMRAWGSCYWWANQSCYYNGLAPANRFELLEPTFAMYTRMLDAAALAAKQTWGSQGIWIPETTFHNGPEKLPDDVAAEMRELYLLRKPWEQRSQRFKDFATNVQSFSSRWNWNAQGGRWELGRWIADDKGAPPVGHVTHIFGTTAKVAYLYWQKYEYTLDESWLRDRAYPMMRGCVEFYRNFPNLRKEADGKYHINHTNSNEPAWGVRDSDEDMAAMRGMIGPCVRASEILNVDADMRPAWKEFLDNLAPVPTSDDPAAIRIAGYTGPRVFVKGLKPAAKAGGMTPDGNTLPHWNFDLCHVESADREMLEIAQATLERYFRGPLGPQSRVGTLSRVPIAAAQLGRADAVRYLLPAQLRASDANRDGQEGVMRNRMALREGPGATECERLGRVVEALHTALLLSAPPTPGGEAIIHVFPAWPKEWDADFTLLARGNFLVTASIARGEITKFQINSQAGGNCRVRNPWNGSLMKMSTQRGETISITREAA